jgi:osmoprotectant transport system substrate-binding protein
MTAPHRARRAPALLAVLATISLAGCGLQPAASYIPDVAPGSIRPLDLPEDASLTVTGKSFTEQLILGKIGVLTAQAAGFEVHDMTGLPGSAPVRNLMVSGQAQVHWDYTGAAWLTYLGQEKGIPDQTAQWQAVREAELDNGITWLEPAPLNNTYAIAIRPELAQKYGERLTTISDIAELPVEERTICVEAEFNSRADGLNPMLEHYGIPRDTPEGVPNENIQLLDTGAIYEATAQGLCNFGEVFGTDGRIQSLDLTVLEDDQQFFPAYNAAAAINTATLEQYPRLEEVFEQVSAALTTETMQTLNRKVDVEGQEPADVAAEWMLANGFITDP